MGDFLIFLISVGIVILQIALALAVFEMRKLLRTVVIDTNAMNLYLRDIRNSVYTEADQLRAKPDR